MYSQQHAVQEDAVSCGVFCLKVTCLSVYMFVNKNLVVHWKCHKLYFPDTAPYTKLCLPTLLLFPAHSWRCMNLHKMRFSSDCLFSPTLKSSLYYSSF
uniref:Uncharacterized protein n=1 Tax=Clytia hemisphaerica TaxID=252671 RepID=A0A7M5XPN7_9CNID